MPNVTMLAPTTFGGSVTGTPSGTVYTPAAGASVTVNQLDVATLAALGFTTLASSPSFGIPLQSVKTSAGVGITATPTGGAFGIAQTLGTSLGLKSETAKNSSVTDVGSVTMAVPPSLPLDGSLALTINAQVVPGSGTLSVKTIDASVYVVGADGTMGADLVSTAAQTLTSSAANYTFTIDGSSVVPGAMLAAKVTMALTETANADAYGKVNSISLAG